MTLAQILEALAQPDVLADLESTVASVVTGEGGVSKIVNAGANALTLLQAIHSHLGTVAAAAAPAATAPAAQPAA